MTHLCVTSTFYTILGYSVEHTVFTPKYDPQPHYLQLKKIPVHSVFNFVHNHMAMSLPQFSDNDSGRNSHLILILLHHCTNFHTRFHTGFMTHAWNHHYSGNSMFPEFAHCQNRSCCLSTSQFTNF
jgi:hypothetical protein